MEFDLPTTSDVDRLNRKRYIESRHSERVIVSDLEFLLKSAIKNKQGGEDAKHLLVNSLAHKYKFWQFGEAGLNSGGNGEAFGRLIAFGIMEDLPEVTPVDWSNRREVDMTDKERVKLNTRPTNRHQEVEIEVNTIVEQDNWYSVKFKFNTSLDTLQKRLDNIETEVDNMREQIGDDF